MPKEIENDKKNAESFSQEATERMKTRVPPNENVNNTTHTKLTNETNENTRATKETRRTKQIVAHAVVTADFRPQRLSEVCQNHFTFLESNGI